jgi:hypothetical protein
MGFNSGLKGLRWSHSPNVVRELNTTLLFTPDTLIPDSNLMLFRTAGLHKRKEISGLNFGCRIYPVESLHTFQEWFNETRGVLDFIVEIQRILTSSTRDYYVLDFDKVAGVNLVLAAS